MLTTANATIAEQYSDSNSDDEDADAEIQLVIECVTCGSILPIDTIAPSERDLGLIECPRCRRVRGPEVLLQ